MDPKPKSGVSETGKEDQHGATRAEMRDPEVSFPTSPVDENVDTSALYTREIELYTD